MPITDQSCQRSICHAYLNHLYSKQKKMLQNSPLEATQGDVLYDSMSILIEKMALTQNDTFIDLGSGTGRVIFHAFLLSNAKEVIGIELEPELHTVALQKKEQIMRELPLFFHEHRTIELWNSNFLTTNVDNVTVAFISAVCFSQTTLRSLAIKLNKLPHLRGVFSLKPLTYLDTLRFKSTIRVQCSWGSALCYWYGV